ncbi:hypothetical protein DPMN_163469 [Dreissena polymorpha]|uniref:Uncharacterized protein n=1 Tax=Dreissena polymorpha TaxID=45954 RepID=A0A9D4EVU2_DREPO|nr:hypothetical protein DPMN_163469 [Dreissena polymorpha]
MRFCRDHLQISDPVSVIQIDRALRLTGHQIDRAHRLGRYHRNKVRHKVAKFKDTQSIMCIKNALKRVDLRRSPYNVTEQYPRGRLEAPEGLVGHMVQARLDGKRVVPVRAKLLIDGSPFVSISIN